MKRYLMLFVTTLCVSSLSYGQGEIDALRMSRNDMNGTARGMGMAGAFGALGGDITGVAANPAGVGVYRSSEIVTTMNFSSNSLNTDWNGSKFNNSQFKFNFDNVAYVGYFPLGNETVSSVNFGFSYNRLKNFDKEYTAGGKGMQTSLSDYIASITNNAYRGAGIPEGDLETRPGYDPYGLDGAPWMSVLGYKGYLINPREDGGNYYNGFLRYPEFSQLVDPNLRMYEKGSIESYDFTLGTNFNDKLYFGLAFSLTDINYSLNSIYSEVYQKNGQGFRYDLENNLITDGTGYQLTAGLIYRPVDALRLGVAYHSPTWYSLIDHYQGFIDDVSTPDIAEAYNEYKMQTPYRWTFSAATILGEKAVLSIDYELADYRAMSFEEPNGYEGYHEDDNVFIDQDFKTASTVKIGAEYKVNPRLALRAGYSWAQNPYEKEFKAGRTQVETAGTVPHYTIEGDINYITCGLGYRITKGFYVDVAFVYRTQTDDLYYYSPTVLTEVSPDHNNSYPAELTNNMYKGVLTLGYKF